MSKSMLPVLYTVYDKLESVEASFESIREYRPKRLYVASDGGKDESTLQRIIKVREYIAKKVDWDCTVELLYRDDNLGCRAALLGAIDWFFAAEDMGIVIEDDCVCSPQFFDACEIFSQKEIPSDVVGFSGTRRYRGLVSGYWASPYFEMWGWLGWASRWQEIREKMSVFEEDGYSSIDWSGLNFLSRILWRKRCFQLCNEEVDSWAFSVTFAMLAGKKMMVLPESSMVTNVGFTSDATHTRPNFIDILFLRKSIAVIPHFETVTVSRSEANRLCFDCLDFARVFLKLIFLKASRFAIKVKSALVFLGGET